VAFPARFAPSSLMARSLLQLMTGTALAHQGPRFSQEQLDLALDSHRRFMQQTGGARGMFRSADLRGLDLSARLLNEADFTDALMCGCMIEGADLERTVLYRSDLRSANLIDANLRYANLRGALLSSAVMNGARMDGADLKRAILAQSEDYDPLGEGEDAEPRTRSADCAHCSMRGVRLVDADLSGVNFAGAILAGADFSGARIEGANFEGAVLTGVPVDRLPFTAEQLAGCIRDPDPAAIERAPQLMRALDEAEAWVQSDGRKGGPAMVDGHDLRPLGQALRGRSLAGFSAKRTCAVGVDFSGCRLEGANFEGADLRCAIFDGAVLRGASFRNAKLAHARFHSAILEPLTLPDGRLHPPSFAGAEITGADFTAVIGDTPEA
jgi:uncharacterized protein YjbI with pentapeptide repeats